MESFTIWSVLPEWIIKEKCTSKKKDKESILDRDGNPINDHEDYFSGGFIFFRKLEAKDIQFQL